MAETRRASVVIDSATYLLTISSPDSGEHVCMIESKQAKSVH